MKSGNVISPGTVLPFFKTCLVQRPACLILLSFSNLLLRTYFYLVSFLSVLKPRVCICASLCWCAYFALSSLVCPARYLTSRVPLFYHLQSSVTFSSPHSSFSVNLSNTHTHTNLLPSIFHCFYPLLNYPAAVLHSRNLFSCKHYKHLFRITNKL